MGLGVDYPTTTGTPPRGRGPLGVSTRMEDNAGRGRGPRGVTTAMEEQAREQYPDPFAPARNPIIDQFNAIVTARQGQLGADAALQYGLAEGGYNNNLWYKTAQAGNDLARLDLQEGREIGLGRERNQNDRGFAQRGFDIDSRGNTLTRDMRYRANDSEAAGRGSITSFGYGQNSRDILGQYGIAQDTTQLQFDKKMADLEIDDKQLDSLGQEYGIRRDDVRNALKYATTQLGLDWDQTNRQIAEMLNSGEANLELAAQNFMTQLMAMPIAPPTLADTFPNGLPGMPGKTQAPTSRASTLPPQNAPSTTQPWYGPVGADGKPQVA